MEVERLIPPLEEMSMFRKLTNTTYLTFLLTGIGLLWPWNNILSATLYFQDTIFKHTTVYAQVFTSSMMSVSTLASLIFNVYIGTRQHSYVERVTRGLIWQIIVFVLLTVLCLVTGSDESRGAPLWVTFTLVMMLVAMSAMATALTQNGILAIANVFGPEFSQAVMLGQAIAGVLPSVVLFILLLFSSDGAKGQSQTGILLYFLTTSGVCLVCIALYKSSRISDKLLILTSQDERESHSLDNNGGHVPLSLLFKKLKYLVLSIFSTFVVSLSFPVFASAVAVGKLPIKNFQFIPLVFTIWNLGDLYGRVIADLPFFRDASFTPYKTFVYSIARVATIPLFLYYTRQSIDERHTWWLDIGYLFLQFVFGVTNGHIVSISFMKVPGQLDSDDEREAAGGFTNIFASVGLTVGSVLSYTLVYLVAAMRHHVPAPAVDR
ncbi:nucleoside transmembrane transporter FUN26 KNAG_0D04850 [Huiozyma naganishii CBS 8797]|uniref:Nucleoside transporter FUN26 n=1 Tax=Huiozyma naganishii (strain ATCC MYA-139 / BCRC 22969 / CBS 8797 / KCTC 17520 / NBRC 10181 / NCYC 3082 / Yp74L-3) TaxID=1071383 RepID=J7S664_HUIN7|nr:hypothetical protein KNAG_0D04850 [Kazachstania naganishii CBS 8797]CCK70224.1 hypothetical protein KNAG_0D04850 [Kazachstania naganishii CBS 8797]